MSVRVQLPAPMRSIVGGSEPVEIEAATVGEALAVLCNRFEPLRERLLKPNGRPKRTITIFVNNTQPPAKPDTPVHDGDSLTVLQPVGGG